MVPAGSGSGSGSASGSGSGSAVGTGVEDSACVGAGVGACIGAGGVEARVGVSVGASVGACVGAGGVEARVGVSVGSGVGNAIADGTGVDAGVGLGFVPERTAISAQFQNSSAHPDVPQQRLLQPAQDWKRLLVAQAAASQPAAFIDWKYVK